MLSVHCINIKYPESQSPLLYFPLHLCSFSCLLQALSASNVWQNLSLIHFKARSLDLFSEACSSVLRALSYFPAPFGNHYQLFLLSPDSPLPHPHLLISSQDKDRPRSSGNSTRCGISSFGLSVSHVGLIHQEALGGLLSLHCPTWTWVFLIPTSPGVMRIH